MFLHRHCERPQGAKQSDTRCRCEYIHFAQYKLRKPIRRSFSQIGWIASAPFASLRAPTNPSLRNNAFFVALVLMFLLGALGGCAPWVQVEGPYRMDAQGFEVNLPAGWRQATFVRDSLLLTRDGVSLQYIRIERVGVGQDLKYTKKKFAKGTSPQEVAEVELDEVRSDQRTRSVELVENTPFQVAGLPGFKLAYTFKAMNGLTLKRVHYGVLVRDWVYRIQYQAPARYYFEKDLATFERIRESFKLTDKP